MFVLFACINSVNMSSVITNVCKYNINIVRSVSVCLVHIIKKKLSGIWDKVWRKTIGEFFQCIK